jgi:uncharacterized protein
MNAIDVRRARVTTDLASFLRFHRSDSDQGSCLTRAILCLKGQPDSKVCSQWRKTVTNRLLTACDLHVVDYDFAMHEKELFEAIRMGDADAVAALLDVEPSLLNSRLNRVTPILFAIYNGRAELARLFLDRGATPTFGEACALGDTALALQMLDGDPALLDSYSDDGFPAVGLAVFFRHPDLARALIERGADVNATARNALRVAPLHAAAAMRDCATMQLLLDHGADVNARQQLGYTTLHTAAQHGDEAMVEQLLAAGADPRFAGDDGKSPADLAAAHGHAAIAERLS